MSFASDSMEQEQTGQVIRLSVEPVAPRRPKPKPQTASTPEPEIAPHEPDPVPEHRTPPPPIKTDVDVVFAAFKGVAMILSARGLLAMALAGAFIMGMVAMIKGGWMPLVALAIYGVSTIAPLVWLEVGRRSRADLPQG